MLTLISKIISNLDIDLNKLKQNKDFADQTLWAIDNTAIQNNISRIDEAESYTVKTEEFVALYTLTYPSKTGVFEDPLDLVNYTNCCSCTDVAPCFDEHTINYPLQPHYIDLIKSEIVKDLVQKLQIPEDKTNDSNDI